MPEDRLTQRTVTVVMAVIAGLAFVFSFGNVWALALRLGVPRPIAPLIAPMVDLSVIGLLVGLRYLSLKGIPARELKGATRLMHASGGLTLGLNVAEPVLAGHYGRAALDAVAPVLLLGWGSVGPTLLRHLHTVTTATTAPSPEPAQVAPAPTLATPVPRAPAPELPRKHAAEEAPEAGHTTTTVPAHLVKAARQLSAGNERPLSAAQLARRLGVARPVADAIHAHLSA
jgi:hypothetical protein